MEQDSNLKRKLAIINIEGKKELDLAYLKYRESIIKKLKEDPSLVDAILNDTEMTEPYLYSILSGEEKANITELDYILKKTLKLKKSTEINDDDNKKGKL